VARRTVLAAWASGAGSGYHRFGPPYVIIRSCTAGSGLKHW